MGNRNSSSSSSGGIIGGVSNINYDRGLGGLDDGDLEDDGDDWFERQNVRAERALGLNGQLPGELPGVPGRDGGEEEDGRRRPENGGGGAPASPDRSSLPSVVGVDPAAFFARGREYEPVNVNHRCEGNHLP